MPHADFGETVVAVLVAENDKIDVEAVTSAVENKLARFKQPRKMIVVDELPRNTMGKVQKNLMREKYANLFD